MTPLSREYRKFALAHTFLMDPKKKWWWSNFHFKKAAEIWDSKYISIVDDSRKIGKIAKIYKIAILSRFQKCQSYKMPICGNDFMQIIANGIN